MPGKGWLTQVFLGKERTAKLNLDHDRRWMDPLDARVIATLARRPASRQGRCPIKQPSSLPILSPASAGTLT